MRDGVSTSMQHVVRNLAKTVEAIGTIVSADLMTCPWRSLQYPLVKEVMEIAALAEKGMGMAKIDDETPAIIIDALSLYMRTRGASHAHHTNAYYEEQKRKRQH